MNYFSIKVAAILNIEVLARWKDACYASNIIADGLRYLNDVAFEFLCSSNEKNDAGDEEESESSQEEIPSSQATVLSWKGKSANKAKATNVEIQRFAFDKEFEGQLKNYTSLLSTEDFLNQIKSSRDFWHYKKVEYKRKSNVIAHPHHDNKFNIIRTLAIIFLNIPASSAYIERFFSICGVIADSRKANQKSDLFITRCMLKANIHLLDNEISSDSDD